MKGEWTMRQQAIQDKKWIVSERDQMDLSTKRKRWRSMRVSLQDGSAGGAALSDCSP